MTFIVASFPNASSYTCQQFQNWLKTAQEVELAWVSKNKEKDVRCEKKGRIAKIHFYELHYVVIHFLNVKFKY